MVSSSMRSEARSEAVLPGGDRPDNSPMWDLRPKSLEKISGMTRLQRGRGCNGMKVKGHLQAQLWHNRQDKEFLAALSIWAAPPKKAQGQQTLSGCLAVGNSVTHSPSPTNTTHATRHNPITTHAIHYNRYS